jgi:hypothetical protein
MNDALTHTSALVRCPVCYSMMSGPWIEGGETLRNCERCHEFLRISGFPTLLIAPPLPMQPGVRAMEGDATCFFHPEKRAERPCDRCGRFLSRLSQGRRRGDRCRAGAGDEARLLGAFVVAVVAVHFHPDPECFLFRNRARIRLRCALRLE